MKTERRSDTAAWTGPLVPPGIPARAMAGGTRRDDDGDTGTITRVKPDARTRLQKPRLFKVLLHNDNYTTRDFVVFLLQTVFHKSEPDAVRIMLHVHQNGVGVAGVFTREVAETKVETVISLARQNEYPLMASMEPEDQGDPDA